MAEPVAVRLRVPIQFGSETITELTIRPPTGKDFRKLLTQTGYELDTVLTLAGRLSGQPDAVIDRLGGDDLAEVFAIVSGFMPAGPATGSTPSRS
jgi:hypothetical protein